MQISKQVILCNKTIIGTIIMALKVLKDYKM